jgi:hypothetical protein
MVLQRLDTAGLTLNTKKCEFATTAIRYLGHELSPEGIRPMPTLVDAVRDFPVPQDAVAVKRFVHMAGYYRRFVPDFGARMAPLTRLLKKRAPWTWTDEQQDAFEWVKRMLTERPLLIYPDFAKPFVLETDASVAGLGACLMQDQGDGLRPIAYASKVNSDQVAKYSITELECLAVVWSVKLFRPYLYGRTFTICTDHAALKWLMTASDLAGRLHRWALTLQEYDFVMQYRSGKLNAVADALSRAPVYAATTNENERNEESLESLQLTDDEIRDEQQRSDMVQQLVKAGEYRGQPITTDHGLAMITTLGGRRTVLPPVHWPVVFKEAHDSIWAGHLRYKHTLGRIAKLYWWPRMGPTVLQWVRGCHDCGSRKVRPRQVIPPLRSLNGGDVGDRWALDIAGKFPISKRGNRFVIAAVEYVTRYAVAIAVENHTASVVSNFLMTHVVFRFGVFRELLTDNSNELVGNVLDGLSDLLQARQVNPVPYRPQVMGLVERFHRTWKDCVSLHVREEHDDWDDWIDSALYAYNSAAHSTTHFSPNELMLGRRLRSPNELLRRDRLTEVENVSDYHERLVTSMERARAAAREAMAREQIAQARYYNRSVRHKREFRVGDLVWVYDRPRGTKYTHRWLGPAEVMSSAGYDNLRVQRRDHDGKPEDIITHVSFVVSYYVDDELLPRLANDIAHELDDERDCSVQRLRADDERRDEGEEAPGGSTSAGEASVAEVNGGDEPDERDAERDRNSVGGGEEEHDTSMVNEDEDRGVEYAFAADEHGNRPKRRHRTYPPATVERLWKGQLVERRRRRRRNRAGRYVLEFEVEPRGIGDTPSERWLNARRRWVGIDQFERLWRSGRVVGDSVVREVV